MYIHIWVQNMCVECNGLRWRTYFCVIQIKKKKSLGNPNSEAVFHISTFRSNIYWVPPYVEAQWTQRWERQPLSLKCLQSSPGGGDRQRQIMWWQAREQRYTRGHTSLRDSLSHAGKHHRKYLLGKVVEELLFWKLSHLFPPPWD